MAENFQENDTKLPKERPERVLAEGTKTNNYVDATVMFLSMVLEDIKVLNKLEISSNARTLLVEIQGNGYQALVNAKNAQLQILLGKRK